MSLLKEYEVETTGEPYKEIGTHKYTHINIHRHKHSTFMIYMPCLHCYPKTHMQKEKSIYVRPCASQLIVPVVKCGRFQVRVRSSSLPSGKAIAVTHAVLF